MALADWFPKKPGTTGKSVKKVAVELDVAALQPAFTAAAAGLEGKKIDRELLCARVADAYRDMGLDPITPEQFENEVIDLDAEGERRLALAAVALDLPEVRILLPHLLGYGHTVREQIHVAFVELSRELPLLTMELLRQSELRVEEFTRHFITRLGAAVIGESAQQSRDRLHRLDYARLLAEAADARSSAEDRLEHLRKLQEEQDKKNRKAKP